MSIGDIILVLIVAAVVFFAVPFGLRQEVRRLQRRLRTLRRQLSSHSASGQEKVNTSLKPSRFAGRFFALRSYSRTGIRRQSFCGSSFPGGEFCREPRRGVPLRAAGAQEGRQPTVFHPLVNLPFSLKGLGADGRLRKQEKGNGRGFLLPRGITPFRISAAVLPHPIWVCAGAA